jgi:hypothetical protein
VIDCYENGPASNHEILRLCLDRSQKLQNNARISDVDGACSSTKRMGEILVIFVLYAIGASTVLVWSTLLDTGRMLAPQVSPRGIEYVAISDCIFFELAEQHPEFVIFDIHADRGVSGWSEHISHWLPISIAELPCVLKWLPPESIVVLCCKNAAQQLDTRTKTMFLELGIGTVYFLDDSSAFQTSRSAIPRITTEDSNREADKITSREVERRL